MVIKGVLVKPKIHPQEFRLMAAITGGKGGRCVRLTTLPPSCAIVMKSGNLNFLEPSGPLQACNGTALLQLPFIGMQQHGTSGRNLGTIQRNMLL